MSQHEKEGATYSWKSEPSLKDGALDSPNTYGVSVNHWTNINIPLRVDTNVLYPHTTYTFTVTLAYNQDISTSASISVTTNGPPILGNVQVQPLSGIELIDIFHFGAYNWEDDDLPLSYGFGYYSIMEEKVILKLPNFL